MCESYKFLLNPFDKFLSFVKKQLKSIFFMLTSLKIDNPYLNLLHFS